MKKSKIFLRILFFSAFVLFIKSGFSQNSNSLNQNSNSKNATGTNNGDSNPKKSKEKVSHNKQGTLTNQSTSDDNLPIDSLNVVPVIIISNQKPQ